MNKETVEASLFITDVIAEINVNMTTHQLDLCRLLCPMPVIKTQNKVKELSSGDRLEIRCTDPGAKEDIPAWCRINGHRVVSIRDEIESFVITIEIG